MLTHRTRLHWILTAVAALLVPVAAHAQQDINDARPVSPTVRIDIEDIIVGSIRVVGVEGTQLTVTGTIGADVDEFVIEGGPEHVEIYVDLEDWDNDDDHEQGRRRWRGREHRDVSVDLEIRVPTGASLDLEGVTADFVVEGVNGEVQIESVTGSITYTGNSSELDLANVTGSITASAPRLRSGSFETINGRIDFTGGVAEGGELDFENVNGSIEITVPADISATFDLETMMGDIVNEFGQEPTRESRWVPSKELRFTQGNGHATIQVETLQGSITIRRR